MELICKLLTSQVFVKSSQVFEKTSQVFENSPHTQTNKHNKHKYIPFSPFDASKVPLICKPLKQVFEKSSQGFENHHTHTQTNTTNISTYSF